VRGAPLRARALADERPSGTKRRRSRPAAPRRRGADRCEARPGQAATPCAASCSTLAALVTNSQYSPAASAANARSRAASSRGGADEISGATIGSPPRA
jgi:hypothetical protein